MTTPKGAAERLADSFDVDVDENVTVDRPSQATQIVDMARAPNLRRLLCIVAFETVLSP